MKYLPLTLLLIPLLLHAQEDFTPLTPVEPTSICKDEIIQARSTGKLKQAAKIAKECCIKSKDAYGCNQYGFFIDMGYIKNPEHNAETYYSQSCDSGYFSGCKNIASSAKNSGDITKAKEYYQKACDLKDGASCAEIIMINM